MQEELTRMISYRDNIVFLFAKAHQRAQGTLKGRLQTFALTPMQCLFMEALWEEDGLSVGEIGRRISLDTATLAGILDRLVTSGWVRREADAQDGRVARVYLTEKGTAAIGQLAAAMEQTNDELLKGFSPEERLLLKRFLKDFRE
ncbi:MarR family winged helix-turn-helix transcriptional regulator [Geotalea toluenoxydans]|uniref:MarR family winged helix-turn-helix transcriptional regulator n=1 Tax=Geotalea toluenoxydans TaxID=421624 RepID=UPI000ADEF217|nr:MarR family transcriptional regulator [Geotalea toluenoxydans]